MRCHFTVVLLVALAAAAVGPTEARAPETLYVVAQSGGSTLLAVDTATGDRREVDLDDYPVIIAVRAGVVAPDGHVYLAAVNAAMSPTVVRLDPTANRVVGVSGYVDRSSDVPRGTGPDFRPGILSLSLGPWGWLYPLRQGSGPMRVDVVSGDRSIVSQSGEPRVGDGVDLSQPVDLVVESSASLLVADRFAGLIRVRVRDGARSVAHRFPDLVEAYHRIDLLADGRLLHAPGLGDGRDVAVFDRGLSGRTELSGPGRGEGPAFAGIADLATGPDGRVYVLDVGLDAVLAVDPETGDRRIISGGPEDRGDGPPLYPANARPCLAGMCPPEDPQPPRRVRGRLP